ncbi:AprI/Inh family metalloprotease inhibitor [uncultured Cohaesibacter sp.]|uniref:AprI/Inh family metalloprotease inhibitor n=1 Tax=uncultured Cohaesibacter sp. TaxID=1002546 RepID=UPI002AA883FB|nr:AprI/Inh family metalloprotease inhibitor [uncultured Cohaesibacter sp.]
MIRYSALLCAGLLLTACSSAGFDRFGGNNASSLNPAPTSPVESQALGTLIPSDQYPNQSYSTAQQSGQPINNAMGAEAELAPPVQNNMSALSQPVPSSARALKRTDLLGAWTLTSGAEQCKLNINLTNWTGGYRASSRGCRSADLQRINAWRLDGEKLVVFLAEDGSTILARFHSNAPGQFSGKATMDGRTLSFAR